MRKSISPRLKSFYSFRTLLFILFLFLFFSNALHEKYPDEFDNILGGWYILHGRFIYSGFFTHHNPVAYFIAAFIEIFSGRNFVLFRFFYTLLLFGYVWWTYTFLRKQFGRIATNFYLVFIGVAGLAATYFWGHMLLADNIAAFCLVPVFSLLVLLTAEKKTIEKKEIIFISVLTTLATLSALTYVYLALCIYGYTMYLALKQHTYKQVLVYLGILAIPYGVFLLYLILTGSLFDWFNQAIVFNGKYYAYNYPGIGQGHFVNPLKYLVIIVYNFFTNFYFLLKQVRDFNFNFPVNITLAIANIALLAYFASRKQYFMAFFAFLFLTFANVRSNPLESGERDYQSAVYIVESLFAFSFALTKLYSVLKDETVYPKKVLLSIIFFFLSLYGFFGVTFFLHYFSDRVFLKYMGEEAMINNHRVNISSVINAATTKNDYVWIGPFDFEELWHTDGKLPSKYQILLPEFAMATNIKDAMMQDFNTHKPVVMYFDKGMGIRGHIPYIYAPFFMDFLQKNYITLYGYHDGKTVYRSVEPVTVDKDIETKLYILKEDKDIVIKRLLNQGIIKKEIAK